MAYNKRKATVKTPAGPRIEKIEVWGSFLTNGPANPVTSSLRGDAFSVVRTSAGLYTVTLGGATVLTGKYGVKQILGIQTQLGKGAAGTPLWAFPGIVIDASGTFQIRLENAAAAATDLPAGADNRVFFDVCFSSGAI